MSTITRKKPSLAANFDTSRKPQNAWSQRALKQGGIGIFNSLWLWMLYWSLYSNPSRPILSL